MNSITNDACRMEIDEVCRLYTGQEIEYIKQMPIFKNFNDTYKIVSNECYKIVQSEVSDLINSGWELYDRIVVTCCNDCVIYTQVLIKTAIVH